MSAVSSLAAGEERVDKVTKMTNRGVEQTFPSMSPSPLLGPTTYDPADILAEGKSRNEEENTVYSFVLFLSYLFIHRLFLTVFFPAQLVTSSSVLLAISF